MTRGLRCARCGARMYVQNPQEASCLCCGEQVALISHRALAARRQVMDEARADAQRWAATVHPGRPRKAVLW